MGFLLVAGCGSKTRAPEAQASEKSPAWSIPVPADLDQTSDPRVVEAVEQARRRVEAEPDSPYATARLGHVYMAHGWEPEAALCYRRATLLDPNDFRWFHYLGKSLLEADPDESTEAFQRCIALNPRYVPALLFHARALRRVGKTDEAERRFSQVIEINPNDSLALQGLGEIELERGELEPAKKRLSRALTLNPGQKGAHVALARLYMTLGDRESAERHAAEAAKPGGQTQVMV
ncbi:MAG: tetratricopeptide repeat protein, partial [Isosphaeraceae bacterium]